ncbi:hypothetical protein [uncultured Vibrio sp.]|uniref:hypothetical protein n=1 Tax=uncultured Vibrio sp. TaxID=114054 RepID=UPI0026146AB3|nr:hypothetical protein [uncultured Vibrio sp.]
MAAQKLTKGRLVQIIIMLVILIAVFTWRTVTYNSDKTIDCIMSKPCQLNIDEHNISVVDDKAGYLIETSETGIFIISVDGSGILAERDESSWSIKTNDKNSLVTVTFPQQIITFSIKLSKE